MAKREPGDRRLQAEMTDCAREMREEIDNLQRDFLPLEKEAHTLLANHRVPDLPPTRALG